MQLRNALFIAIDRCGLSAKELSEKSGVSQAQISRFRKGEDLAFSTYEKLIKGLPREAYHHFCALLMVEQMNNQELGDLIMTAVTQLQKKSVELPIEGLDKNKSQQSTVSAA